MSQEVVQQLLNGALKAIRGGQKDLARRAYLKVLQMEPENETAFLGLAMVAKNQQEQHLALRRVYALYPESPKVSAILDRLSLTPVDIGAQAAPPKEEKPPRASSVRSVDDLIDALPDTGEIDDAYATEPEVTPQDDMYNTLFGDEDEVDEDEVDEDEPEDAVDAGSYLDVDSYASQDEPIEAVPAADDPYQAFESYQADEIDDEPDLYEESAAYDESDDDFGDVVPTEQPGPGSLYDALFDEDDDEDDTYAAPVSDAEDKAVDAYDGEEADLPDIEPEPEAEPVVKLEPLDLSETFANIQMPQAGRGGIPIISKELVASALPEVEQALQQVEAERAAEPAIRYAPKEGRRSGERDWLIFRMQVGAAAAIGLVFVGFLVILLLNAPGAPLAVARALRSTATPTPTATATPGITHTPSPTPRGTLTPEPTLPSNFPLGDPTLAPPPTQYYLSPGILTVREVEEAIPLIQAGRTNEAVDLLLQGVQATRATGNFLPYYWLSIAYLNDDRVDDADDAIAEGEEAWQERGINVNARPLIQVAKARVELYKAENNLGPRSELLEDAEERLLDVISGGDGDGRFVEAYLLLADRFMIGGEENRALQALERAYRDTLRGDLLGDSQIRLKRADILAEQGRYDAALFELNTLLRADNFVEQAHIRRVEIALQMGEPGRAVKYAEAYAFYIPGHVAPYMLWGDAHLAEGKIDWALQYYSRGLNGDPGDPYYLPTLLKRASILIDQGDYDLAFADYDQALAISNDDPDVRLQRMIAAYESGNAEVAEADLQALTDENVDLSGQSMLVMGRILLDTGEEAQQALNLIERAVNVAGVDGESRRIADAYRARAFLALERYDDGLEALARLGDIGENMELRALRGQLLLERGRESNSADDLHAALRDFEFVLSWEEYLPTDRINLDTIRAEYETLSDELG
ncbi:MAG: hypothetical protein CL607_09955 [Anaerolineaceae bacterium]|nr:hypothetical protein [Anaerolineaceae bacterium]